MRFFTVTSAIAVRTLHGARLSAASAVLMLALVWSSVVPAAVPELPFGQGVLWKIELPSGDTQPSFLFGTVHSSDKRILKLPLEVRRAFAGARSATFEIRTKGSDTARMSEFMQLPPDKTLDDFLSDEQMDLLRSAAEEDGINERVWQQTKPWALGLSLSLPQSERKRAQRGRKVLDFSLQTRARDFGIPVYGLETLDEQLAVFDEMPVTLQIEYLELTLRSLDEREERFESLLQDYLARDLDALHARMNEGLAEVSPESRADFQDKLLDRRNFNMAERMEERLREGGAFVAVGALHLSGEKGVLNLLQSKGYSLTRVY
jgi:hypothetical protein